MLTKWDLNARDRGADSLIGLLTQFMLYDEAARQPFKEMSGEEAERFFDEKERRGESRV